MMMFNISFTPLLLLLTSSALVLSAPMAGVTSQRDQAPCEYWVAPEPLGDDANPGSATQPWATLEHASAAVPDDFCTVWFKPGLYVGTNNPKERFTTRTTFKAERPYQAILEHSGPVIELDGVRNMVFEGFELRHAGPGAGKYLVIMDRRDDVWSEHVVFRNNIFHDSYNNDLFKIHNGARFVTVENNVFYNQAESEQHMDVNSVTDIMIQGNIFFNDFAGSGREIANNSKHFIVVKDSNEGSDGLLGSERIQIRGNIFLNWQGGSETWVQIGNDGKPYHEAEDVHVENNLMIGNSPILSQAAFGVRGAKNVTFNNNTVVGDLPSKAYAMRLTVTEENPLNENIVFRNNVWSDPTGTMGVDLSGGEGEFSDGDPAETIGLVLENNLYWNGAEPIPEGEVLSPLNHDPHPTVADPVLEMDQDQVVLPRWTGSDFLSGNMTIEAEFARLAEQYGQLPAGSPAIAMADRAYAPAIDILARSRSATPDLGAYEYRISLRGSSDLTAIHLRWSPPHEPDATSLTVTYKRQDDVQTVTGIPVSARETTLTGLEPYSIYTMTLSARGPDDSLLAQSNQIALFTTDRQIYLPVVLKGPTGAVGLVLRSVHEWFLNDYGR